MLAADGLNVSIATLRRHLGEKRKGRGGERSATPKGGRREPSARASRVRRSLPAPPRPRPRTTAKDRNRAQRVRSRQCQARSSGRPTRRGPEDRMTHPSLERHPFPFDETASKFRSALNEQGDLRGGRKQGRGREVARFDGARPQSDPKRRRGLRHRRRHLKPRRFQIIRKRGGLRTRKSGRSGRMDSLRQYLRRKQREHRRRQHGGPQQHGRRRLWPDAQPVSRRT